MRGRIIELEVTDKRGKAAKTIPLYQYDYGQKLLIKGVELPEYYEVHFSNQQYGDAITVLGDSTGVLIPDSLVATGETIYVWLFLHDTSYDGETEYMGAIPVIKRAQPTDVTPTPEEQSIITEVIAALNNMEGDMSEQVQAAESAKEAAQTAQTAAEGAATTASGYVDTVTAAQTAAEAAQAAAETAATSATASATSATSSANSANNALAEATNAKIAAVDAASAASTSATTATTASGNASNYATSAESAKVDAVAAQTAAEAAQTAAETAQGKAENAQGAAETAQTAAEAAQTAAEAAQTAAETAQGKAEDAEDAAEDSAEDSEAYAVGTRNGVDVDSDDPAYENNAKYYAEEAATVLEDKLDAPATAGTAGQVLTSDGEGGQAWADPSGAIDDTAGEGDTDVTWSADKLDGEFTDVLNAIQGKPEIKETVTQADLFICDQNGNVIAELKDGHIITKNFNSADIDADLIKTPAQSTADLYVCDANGNVIAEFANGHIKTKYFDSSTSATAGIMNRVNKQTDGVYAACRWHQPNLSSKQFCMLLGADIHYEATRMSSMVEYLNSVSAFDAGIMLGDMSGNTFADTIDFYKTAIQNSNKPFLTVIGNHDVDGAQNDTELYEKYGDCFQYAQLASGEAVAGKCYYYKDFANYKIRIIVLKQYDIKYDGGLCFGQDQIDWFVNVLNNTPSDYGVIIAEHTNPSRYMTYNMDESVTSSTWYQSNYAPSYMDGDPVPDIVNAWINGTTLTQTYSYTFSNPPSPLSVDVDFSNRGTGEFISYIGGHWHMNVLGTPTGFTDQKDLHVPAAGLVAATQGDMPRMAGIVSEDSLCAIAIDRDKKAVKVFQIGAHYTKDAVDRQYFKYSYGS